MQQWSIISRSDVQTRALGRVLGPLLPASAIVLLQGTLGAGKTVLAQGIARGVGVAEETAVNSPTYTLVNQYTGTRELYHFDLYRLSDPDELFEIGFDEYAHGAGVAVVEWPERIGVCDFDCLKVVLTVIDSVQRELTFWAFGDEYQRVLDQLSAAVNDGPQSLHNNASRDDNDTRMKE